MGFWADTISKMVPSLAREIARIEINSNAVSEAAGQLVDENANFHQLGSSRRDTSFVNKTVSLDEAVSLYEKNPFAKWLLETMRDLIVGQGVSATSPDDTVQGLIDDFWRWPTNNMSVNIPQNTLELLLFGEQLLPVARGTRGMPMSLTTVDPGDIEQVFHDPDNGAMPIGVKRRSDENGEGKEYKIVYRVPDNQLFGERAQALRSGRFSQREAFWFKINALRVQTRGRSEYYALRDWLVGYENQIYNRVERTDSLQSFFWDVMLRGATAEQIDDFIAKNPPPENGAMRAHNEDVEWKAVSPEMQSFEFASEARVTRNHILGASGFPEHWSGGGGDVNRACYSSDTKVLTKQGFMSFEKIEPATEILQYVPPKSKSHGSGNLEWVPAGPCYSYPYSGDMIHFENQMTDILVTPDHRMWVKKKNPTSGRHLEKWEILEAGTIADWPGQHRQWAFLNHAPYEHVADLDYFKIPARPDASGSNEKYGDYLYEADNFLEFLGYWLSEGYVRQRSTQHGYEFGLSQKKPDRINPIRKCLQKMKGIRWREYVEKDGRVKWEAADKGLYFWLRQHGGIDTYTRAIPDVAKHLCPRQASILLEALMYGDGTNHADRESRKESTPNQTHRTYFSASKQLTDDVQALAIGLGYRTSIWTDTRGNQSYHLGLTPGHPESIIRTRQVKRVPYSGKVFCYSVPSGIFVTRRKGKIAIQGNTAQAMDIPTFLRYTARQETVRLNTECILDFQLGIHVADGLITEEQAKDYEIVMPQISTDDLKTIGATLKDVTAALIIAQTNGWASENEVRDLFRVVAERTGVRLEQSDDTMTPAESKIIRDHENELARYRESIRASG